MTAMNNKTLIIIAAALLPFAACTKVTTGTEDVTEHEISFQVANYVRTKAPVAFENPDFGTYAWYTADDGSQQHVPFMTNEPVAFDGTSWTTTNRPYYWPKVGALDFISYSPYSSSWEETLEDGTIVRHDNPVVTGDSISWTDYRTQNEDLMYADKVTGQRQNGSTYTAVSGVTGVPTLFHHALAKLGFRIRVNFLEEGEGDQKTTWEVYLRNASVVNLREGADLTLSLKEDNTWTLPDVEGYHVWDTKDTWTGWTLYSTSSEEDAGLALTTEAQPLYTDESGEAKPLYVIPQILVPTDYESEDWTVGQQLHLDLTIITHLPGNPDDSGNPLVITENIPVDIDLVKISSLKAWQMNQDILYTINIKPTATNGQNDTPTDVAITFDPAVGDWETVYPQATIQL